MGKNRSNEKKLAIIAVLGMMSAVWLVLQSAGCKCRGADDDVNHDTYIVSVDYTRTLAQMIEVGKYDWEASDITEEHFPIERPSNFSVPTIDGGHHRTLSVQNCEVKLVLVHLNNVARTDEVVRYMDKLGLRPARIEELLAFGEKYPDIQRHFPVAAIGSFWVDSGHRNVPFLDSGSYRRISDERRILSLDWDGRALKWADRYRFLAVSK